MILEKFQSRVAAWVIKCFGDTVAYDRTERNHRFLEEALELAQSLNCTKDEANLLVDYVFNRPPGEPNQEVGGVMVTLAALCHANNMDMQHAGEIELTRVNSPLMVEKIRAKNASKPRNSPLPGKST